VEEAQASRGLRFGCKGERGIYKALTVNWGSHQSWQDVTLRSFPSNGVQLVSSWQNSHALQSHWLQCCVLNMELQNVEHWPMWQSTSRSSSDDAPGQNSHFWQAQRLQCCSCVPHVARTNGGHTHVSLQLCAA
jgi:hypothetical protein